MCFEAAGLCTKAMGVWEEEQTQDKQDNGCVCLNNRHASTHTHTHTQTHTRTRPCMHAGTHTHTHTSTHKAFAEKQNKKVLNFVEKEPIYTHTLHTHHTQMIHTHTHPHALLKVKTGNIWSDFFAPYQNACIIRHTFLEGNFWINFESQYEYKC